MNWVMIRTILASVADMAIIPLQDVLGFGQRSANELARQAQRQLAVAVYGRPTNP